MGNFFFFFFTAEYCTVKIRSIFTKNCSIYVAKKLKFIKNLVFLKCSKGYKLREQILYAALPWHTS